jgi:uroporphyrin-III C-methyltransferase
MSARRGFVYLVGAGPGDPELLTIKAARALAQADTVIHDRLVHPRVLSLVRPGTRLIFAGKEGGGPSVAQDETTSEVIAQAQLGRVVVRLKGGDPFVFGRGGEEALALEAAGIPYQVVPGVSSVIGAPASAGIPLTHRGVSSSVTFATASRAEGEPDWAHLAGAETLLLLMTGGRLEHVADALMAAGRDAADPAAMIEAGTWRHQRVVVGTLATIASLAQAAEIGSPSLLVLGQVVTLRAQLPSLSQLASDEWLQPTRARGKS